MNRQKALKQASLYSMQHQSIRLPVVLMVLAVVQCVKGQS